VAIAQVLFPGTAIVGQGARGVSHNLTYGVFATDAPFPVHAEALVSATGKVVASRSIAGIAHLTRVGSIVHFSGVLASVPKVRQIAGAQELGGVRRVIGARPIIETRIVFFTD
jgi:hypothetical protein